MQYQKKDELLQTAPALIRPGTTIEIILLAVEGLATVALSRAVYA